MKKFIILALLTLNLGLSGESTSGTLYINPAEQFIKKSTLPTSIRAFIEKKLDLTLTDHDILTEISVCSCSCHDFKDTSCPAFPKYLPLSLFIDKNPDGSFKLNSDGTLKFKTENTKVLVNLKERNDLVRATLCLKQLGGNKQKLEHALQQMYQVFKKQNPGYAQAFEGPAVAKGYGGYNKNNSKILMAKLKSIMTNQRMSKNK